MVTALGRLGGHAVGVVANQPSHRAGTLDIEASRKAARFVEWCDSFNLPILTFVDTPGFEPGRDLEWRGMIRHGAQLVHAYCAATVPRVCVVLRKAYGGAYIVMDSQASATTCVSRGRARRSRSWARPAAVQILHGRRLPPRFPMMSARPPQRALVDEYEAAFSNPYRAAERGYVDAVIEPADTRTVVLNALEVLATKRDTAPAAPPLQRPALTASIRGRAMLLDGKTHPRHRRAQRRDSIAFSVSPAARRKRAPRSCSRRSGGR